MTDFAQRHAVERAARRVSAVRAIAREIEVRLPHERRPADNEIAARATRLLEWDLRLPPQSIQLTVEQGIVVLSGSVPWDYQPQAAEADVRKLGGVINVINHLKVRPVADPIPVEARIRSAFSRAADLDAARVHVTLEDGAAPRCS